MELTLNIFALIFNSQYIVVKLRLIFAPKFKGSILQQRESKVGPQVKNPTKIIRQKKTKIIKKRSKLQHKQKKNSAKASIPKLTYKCIRKTRDLWFESLHLYCTLRKIEKEN